MAEAGGGQNPKCRRVRSPIHASAGAHAVTYDRPGYGQSDRHRGRSVADCAADVAAIADALGFDRFAVRGGSRGGPHARNVPGTTVRVEQSGGHMGDPDRTMVELHAWLLDGRA
jgi:pimeloyl-ACP methyl ester carboxylesterase